MGRPRVVEHEERDDDEKWRQQDKRDERGNDVDAALEDATDRPIRSSADVGGKRTVSGWPAKNMLSTLIRWLGQRRRGARSFAEHSRGQLGKCPCREPPTDKSKIGVVGVRSGGAPNAKLLH